MCEYDWYRVEESTKRKWMTKLTLDTTLNYGLAHVSFAPETTVSAIVVSKHVLANRIK